MLGIQYALNVRHEYQMLSKMRKMHNMQNLGEDTQKKITVFLWSDYKAKQIYFIKGKNNETNKNH